MGIFSQSLISFEAPYGVPVQQLHDGGRDYILVVVISDREQKIFYLNY